MLPAASMHEPLMLPANGGEYAGHLHHHCRHKARAGATIGHIVALEGQAFDSRKGFINKIYLPLITCKHYLVPRIVQMPDERYATTGVPEAPVERGEKDFFKFLGKQ